MGKRTSNGADTQRLGYPLRAVLSALAGLFIAMLPSAAFSELAVLVDQGVLVETNPVATDTGDDNEEVDGEESENSTGEILGGAINATYRSSGGWAITGSQFIDVNVVSFDFGSVGSVTAATLILPVDEVFAQNGSAPLEVFYFSDDGVIRTTDYSTGLTTPITRVNAFGQTELRVTVTGPVNAALGSSRFVGFRVRSAVSPGSVEDNLFPPYTGARLGSNIQLEFVPGAPPALEGDLARFDGFNLRVPEIQIPGFNLVSADFQLVDPNELTFELIAATEAAEEPPRPIRSGIELFECSAFSAPEPTDVAAGVSSYAVNSGILDVPSLDFNGDQVSIRLEYIEGSNPWLFETLNIGQVQSGPSEATISALGGGAVVEPSQDFVPLCHGWVLIGDSLRNRVVERNLISGETGNSYPFTQIPDQFTLDDQNNRLFMTVYPDTERLYFLDLETGRYTFNAIEQRILSLGGGGFYDYTFSLFDLALGENGDVYALMQDNALVDPGEGIPYSDTGRWLGFLDPFGEFRVQSIPLEEPVRVEYDPVRDNVFLATASNLATFDFDVFTTSLSFVDRTDLAVGESCTDFDISPDGESIAYSCPNGNRPGDDEGSIVDMDPRRYFESSGVWYLGSAPVSATFNFDGTILIATDNEKLFFFDRVTHLPLEDFELGLLEGEQIRKIRLSRDGQLLYLFLDNEVYAENSKFYWMNIPDIVGTPLGTEF